MTNLKELALECKEVEIDFADISPQQGSTYCNKLTRRYIEAVSPDTILELLEQLDVQAGSIEAVQAANQRLAAKLAAYESRKPVAGLVEVRRTDGHWQRYNVYDNVSLAEDTKQRTNGNGIEVRVVPLFTAPEVK